MGWNITPEVERSLEKLARDEALLSQEDLSYLPKTPEAAEKFQPHDWVMESLRRAYSLGRIAGTENAQADMRKSMGIVDR